MKTIAIEVDLAKYKYVDLPLEDAKEFLYRIRDEKGELADIGEVLRYLDNFKEFYEYLQKKFKDYLAVPHRPDDYIRGSVLIDRVKLYVDKGEKRVVLVFDRRISTDFLADVLSSMGYSVEVKKIF